ncbi:hypothetical protein WICPIJ_005514 [Wickerhamomyces pijperi]|uniref:Uncharacterized protein n=1 Tax=Wickerhamomyces pijperi TaxID=599730 RepID=A0A9P8Q3D7_WICPI|nr:hypothetical protein WICPIJ_005514 [Wickerhamomyces pijperi]
MRLYQRLFRKSVYDVNHSIDVLVNSKNGIFLFPKSKDYHTNIFENVNSIDFKINREDRSMKLTLEEQLEHRFRRNRCTTHYELFYHLHTRSATRVENQEIGYNDFGEGYMTEEKVQSMKQYKKQSRANQLRAENIKKEIKIIMHLMVQSDDHITELEPIRYTEISIWNSFNSEKAIMSNINSNSLLSDINQYRSDHNKEAFRRELHYRSIKNNTEIAANEMKNTRKSPDKVLFLREERSKPIKYHDFSQIYDRNARFKLYKDTNNDSSDEKKTGSLDSKLTGIKSNSNKEHDSFDSALDDFDRIISSGTSKSLDTSDLSSKVIQVCRSVVIISLFVVLAFVIGFDLLVSL